MAEQREFTLKQIVWAKVPEYPWWPARIAKNLTQRNKNIYKVNFFGDPTYCFLEQSQLLVFEDGLARLEQGIIDRFNLRKPIQLAKAAHKKYTQELTLMQQSLESSHEVQPSNPYLFEETKIESKPSLENSEKIEEEQKSNEEIQNNEFSILQKFSEISIENVTSILDGTAFKQLKFLKGYANKKEAQVIKQTLKDTLLAKYRLNELESRERMQQKVPESSISLSGNMKRKIWKRHLIKKSKKVVSVQDHCQQIKKKSVRKIYKILSQGKIKSEGSTQLYRQKALNIMGKMEQKYSFASKQYKRDYKSLLHWIKVQLENIQETQSSNFISGSSAGECNINEDSFFGQMSCKSALTNINSLENRGQNITCTDRRRKNGRKGRRGKNPRKMISKTTQKQMVGLQKNNNHSLILSSQDYPEDIELDSERQHQESIVIVQDVEQPFQSSMIQQSEEVYENSSDKLQSRGNELDEEFEEEITIKNQSFHCQEHNIQQKIHCFSNSFSPNKIQTPQFNEILGPKISCSTAYPPHSQKSGVL